MSPIFFFSLLDVAPCQDYQEHALSSAPSILSVLTNPLLSLPAQCSLDVSVLLCTQAFPTCINEKPCASMCQAVLASCGGPNPATSPTIGLLSAFMSLNCTAYATTNCHAPPTTFIPAPASPPRCDSYTTLTAGTTGVC